MKWSTIFSVLLLNGFITLLYVFLMLGFSFNIFHFGLFTVSADQSLEPERLERQRKISWLKDRVKALQDQEISVNQEMEQFQQAIEKDKEEHTRIR